jgi:hypothetical protein
MWMQITLNPFTPTAGEPVSVSVLTFSATQNLCWDDPRITPMPEATWYGGGDTPLNLGLEMVVSNSRQGFTIPLFRRSSDGAYWDGTLNFPSGGEWQLYAKQIGASPNPSSADRCGGLVRTVEVQPTGPAANPTIVGSHKAGFFGSLIFGVMVLAIAAAAGVGLLAKSRLRRH